MTLYEVITVSSGSTYYYELIKGATYFATTPNYLKNWEALTLTIL